MTEIVHTDPCVLFALAREAKPFLKDFPPQQTFPGAPFRARFCGPPWLSVLVGEMGVGQERAQQAIDWILSAPKFEGVPYRPKLVVCAGFAGGLDPKLKVGDVVVATSLVDAEDRSQPTTWPAQPLAGAWQPTLHLGKVITAARLIGTSEEKLALGKKHQALAVDMESAVVGRTAAAKGVPFGCVRVLSDDAHSSLSVDLAETVLEGQVKPMRLLGALCRRPRLVVELWRLARHTHGAARQLGKALGELLTLTLDWLE